MKIKWYEIENEHTNGNEINMKIIRIVSNQDDEDEKLV